MSVGKVRALKSLICEVWAKSVLISLFIVSQQSQSIKEFIYQVWATFRADKSLFSKCWQSQSRYEFIHQIWANSEHNLKLHTL